MNEKLEIIKQEIIKEFGEQYKDMIEQRLNTAIIILQSHPKEEYQYVKNHKEQFDPQYIAKMYQIDKELKKQETISKLTTKDIKESRKKILEGSSPYITNLKRALNTDDITYLNKVTYHIKSKHFSYLDKDNNPRHVVFVPIAKLLNDHKTNLDHILIHEMIHAVCKEKEYTNDERILNEVNVDRHAIKITTRLHEKGIYILDNKKNNQKEQKSTYQALFKLTDYLIINHEPLLINCLLNSNYSALKTYFTPSLYKQYLTKLNSIYQEYQIRRNNSENITIKDTKDYPEALKILNQMDLITLNNNQEHQKTKRHI